MLHPHVCFNVCNAFNIRKNSRNQPQEYWCGHDLAGKGSKLCLWTLEEIGLAYDKLKWAEKVKPLPKLVTRQ